MLEEVLIVDLHKEGSQKQLEILVKLHKQFGHCSMKKLVGLIKDSGAWRADLEEVITKVYDDCRSCKEFKRKPDKPAVSLPMASTFNQVVTMDLKKWGTEYILYIVDMFSRYSMSVFINRKLPRCVIDKLMLNWVSIFGVMKTMFYDNGGEFTAAEISEVASELNVQNLDHRRRKPLPERIK